MHLLDTMTYMAAFSYFIFGVTSGFLFRVYALLVLSPLCFAAGFLIGLARGQEPGTALWYGMALLVVFQLAYLLGVIGDSLLNRD